MELQETPEQMTRNRNRLLGGALIQITGELPSSHPQNSIRREMGLTLSPKAPIETCPHDRATNWAPDWEQCPVITTPSTNRPYQADADAHIRDRSRSSYGTPNHGHHLSGNLKSMRASILTRMMLSWRH